MNKLFKKINPNILFITSIMCLPAVFFVQNTAFTWAICFLFMFLVILKKKSIKLLPSIIIFLSIVFFNLLTPSGKIVFTIGSIKITEGALLFGLQRAGILLSMVFISQYAISKNLHIKGTVGIFINNMFYYFDKLTEHKSKFTIKKPFESIDSILIEVYNDDEGHIKASLSEYKKQEFSQWVICILPLIICYTLLAFSFI